MITLLNFLSYNKRVALAMKFMFVSYIKLLPHTHNPCRKITPTNLESYLQIKQAI